MCGVFVVVVDFALFSGDSSRPSLESSGSAPEL